MLLLLAACGTAEPPANGTLAQVEAAQRRSAEDDGRILCAHGREPLARTCTVEQLRDGDRLVLTVRHDDGGFHRLLVTRDGRGVVAADGAGAARVTVVDGGAIDVALGQDRYRLPATVKGR